MTLQTASEKPVLEGLICRGAEDKNGTSEDKTELQKKVDGHRQSGLSKEVAGKELVRERGQSGGGCSGVAEGLVVLLSRIFCITKLNTTVEEQNFSLGDGLCVFVSAHPSKCTRTYVHLQPLFALHNRTEPGLKDWLPS